MRWVASRARVAHKHLAIAVVIGPLLAGLFAFISTDSISIEPAVPEVLSCFDESSATIRVTTEVHCPVPLISLGSGALSESATATGLVNEIHPLLQARFDAAKVAAARVGVNLYMTSGFRSEARQAMLFADAIEKYGSETEAAKWVLPPKSSHHPEGLAIDINYPGDRAGAQWLELNGTRFGLCRVYANEWWHFEGVIAPGGDCPRMAPNALVDMR
jgi:D-alanyl-D-alanine carboxypeptidase